MADKSRSAAAAGGRRQPSRLQRRAPASLQIASHASQQWNVAIPLLSPLASSPTSPPLTARLADRSSAPPAGAGGGARQREEQPEKKPAAAAYKKWQHPAAPFCYEPAPRKPSFVPG
ncbi:hypothetical protein BT93_L2444 [Corymbia citriodora subsp. variegata]|uniref:Uncharacterized protein n=1 Tax=Corymbia citriodora subsp. variegata TaxID=360336 RepID=A0A8T0CK53_CORYI|nr:hypothetical protein BT93_L3261 [Corymbia citriodora subsp. variegata]KAF7847929.1 hypothetical protein BT93_L2444 [Corymbia citriodora subsp. variegata]